MEDFPYLGFEQLGYNPNFEIALNMSLDQLRFYCTSNFLFRDICGEEEFWLERLRRYYPKVIQYKPDNLTWAQYYLEAPLIDQILITRAMILPKNIDPYQIAQMIKSLPPFLPPSLPPSRWKDSRQYHPCLLSSEIIAIMKLGYGRVIYDSSNFFSWWTLYLEHNDLIRNTLIYPDAILHQLLQPYYQEHGVNSYDGFAYSTFKRMLYNHKDCNVIIPLTPELLNEFDSEYKELNLYININRKEKFNK